MKKTTGFIILMDIPKEKAQLDLLAYDIEGGFRGFSSVRAGPHYVNVKRSGEMQKGFWCVVPEDGVVIRVFDAASGSFKEDTPENVAHHTELAKSGAMNKVLAPAYGGYPVEAVAWEDLTKHLALVPFPPELHVEQPMSPPAGVDANALGKWFEGSFKSRFEQAFLGTHGGDVDSFLAELEYAYVQMLACDDKAAGDRWRHLILAAFNAGDYAMCASPGLLGILSFRKK
nr:hypothetical protein [Candidatus Sigynarchaeum springense]